MDIFITTEDPNIIRALKSIAPGSERDEYITQALRVGLIALQQATVRLDTEFIQKESNRLVEELQKSLSLHTKIAQEKMNTTIQDYFDPESGRFNERVQRLIGKEGELATLINKQLSGEDSVLVKTLISHVGHESKLMKQLDPKQSDGLLSLIQQTVESSLGQQKKHILGEFSLDNETGALSRLVRELTNKHGNLSKDLQGKIDEVIKEFSLDQEDSALNRMVQNMNQTRETISKEFSLDNQESAFSRLKNILETTQGAIQKNLTLDDDQSPLSRLKRELLELLNTAEEKNTDFRQEVKVSLATIVSTRKEALRSTRHGADFEAAVVEFVTCESQKIGDIATPTGSSPGVIARSKVGDVVIELGPESPAPGSKIVLEAKEDKSYSLKKALTEMEVARKNRQADIGIFIFSKNSAPESLESFQRLGSDLIVVWDAEDPTTDVYLKAAIITARVLSFRENHPTETNADDFATFEAAILDIETRAKNLDLIGKSAQSIENANEKILSRVRTDQKALTKQIDLLREVCSSLRKALGNPN